METSLTISFSPDAPTVYTPPTPTPGFTLNFAVDLIGGGASGAGTSGLSASLTIPFSVRSDWALICDRATLTGINPIGHAPLVIHSASYVGSTCDYGDPETWPAYLVYLDDAASTAELHIGFPTTNLYGWFSWPAGISTFSPALISTEQRPPLRLELSDFVDVQLPMRLAFEIPQNPLDNGNNTLPSTVMLRELTYHDAPTFSASSYSVQCTGASIPFVLTAPELASALTPYGPGTYDLYWRIYRGAGDMTYRGRCIERDIGSYTDRIVGIGGGFGIEMDTEILAARVETAWQPGPFYIDTDTTDYCVRGDASYRAMTCAAGNSVWLGTLHGKPLALSWASNGLYIAGRLARTYPSTVLCACVRSVAAGAGYPAHEQIVTLCNTSATQTVYVWRLLPNETPQSLVTHTRPSITPLTTTYVPHTSSYQFSPDTTRVLCFAVHSGTRFGGAVWTLDDWADGESEWVLHSSLWDSSSWSVQEETRANFACAWVAPLDPSGTGVVEFQYSWDLTIAETFTVPWHNVAAWMQVVHGASWSNANVVEVWILRAEINAEARQQLDYSVVGHETYGHLIYDSANTGAYTRTLTLKKDGVTEWSIVDSRVEYSSTSTLDFEVESDETTIHLSGEVVQHWDREYQNIRLLRFEQPGLVVASNWGHWRWQWNETQPIIIDLEISSFPIAVFTGMSGTETVPNKAQLTVNDKTFEIDQWSKTHAIATTDLSSSINYPYDSNMIVGDVKTHLLSVVDLLYSDQGSGHAKQDANSAIAGYLNAVSGYGTVRIHDGTDWLTVEDEDQNDILYGATVSKIALVTPHACLIPFDQNATVPSGDPVLPPTYEDLLTAVNRARANANVGDHAVITDVQVSGGVTYQAAALSTTLAGVIRQDWTVVFTDAALGLFRLDGDTLGTGVTTGSLNDTLAPLNPATNTPYFTLLPVGWGGTPAVGATLTFTTTRSPLTEDSALITAAALHAQWMSDQDVIQEIGINGTTPIKRAKQCGYQGTTIGELRVLGPTVGQAADLAEDIVAGWLATPVDAAVILDPDWTVVGGYVVPGSTGGYVWCLELGVSA